MSGGSEVFNSMQFLRRKKPIPRIEVVDLDDMPPVRTDGRSANREYAVITYGFFLLFLAMSVYFVYFVGFAGEEFINNPYNPRLSMFADTTTRGSIYSADDALLAETQRSDAGEKRVYPKGSEYAHVVGFSSKGMAGAELSANFYLLRSHSFIVDRIKNEMRGEKDRGDSVWTSLDSRVMDAAYAAMGYFNGAAVAIDPDTGHILALVSKPDFDPNGIDANWEYYTSDPASSVLLNRAVQGLYPPGSTFKILTALEYLKEGGSLEDSFECTGTFSEDGTTIHCYHSIVHGAQTFEEAFGNSCNCAFAKVGLSINNDAFKRLLKRALFGRTLPADIRPTEKSSFSLDHPDTALIMQTAIGQGETLVTPLHMAMLAAAISNHGVLMEPSLLTKIKSDNGTTVKTFHEKEYGAIFEEDENDILRQIMRFAVEHGTVGGVNASNYTAYGKTGTAEFSENSEEAHSWFVGFAESDEKKIALAVILERAGSGSEFAVPFARKVFDAYFQ